MEKELLEHDPKLAEIVRRLAVACKPERIYLFGSKARGEAGPDSDYDLLVIVPDSDLPPQRRDQQAYRALRRIGAAKDVMVWTRAEFESRAHVVTSLPATILREGKLVYEAGAD
jgi:predicted nucleotidyltransferase